jgi:superfamily II DNA/RNA helicase
MVGTAFTGSGKTITFTFPMVMAALEEEMRLPLVVGEGPAGLILTPSHELARQMFDVVQVFCNKLAESLSTFPKLRQLENFTEGGVHYLVATHVKRLLHADLGPTDCGQCQKSWCSQLRCYSRGRHGQHTRIYAFEGC